VVNVELIAASGGWVLRGTLGENNSVHKIYARIVNNCEPREHFRARNAPGAARPGAPGPVAADWRHA